jgi:hypothetical protein
MSNFDWKITETSFIDKNIDFLKYKVTATEGDLSVETEGYAKFKLPEEVVFENLIESELLEYLKRFYIQEGVNTIEFRLSEQLAYLQRNASTIPPWHVETFKLEI